MRLNSFPLAIVDVETTGTSPAYHRIIEIAVIRIENGNVVRTFESLVNPRRFVHPSITAITGIESADLISAPAFEEIADCLHDILDDCVFVAHNARFDYQFIKMEMDRCKSPFSGRTLCTVRLSRKLYPEYRNHDLGSVIARHGISCPRRHRAMGDAIAVRDFLMHVMATETPERIELAMSAVMKSSGVPSLLDVGAINILPETPGVYLFYGPRDEVLYVGKSVNLRERVRSHFAPGNDHAMYSQVARIEHRGTAGELGALLLESSLIKELRPLHNQRSRRRKNLVTVSCEKDKHGYTRTKIDILDNSYSSGSPPPGLMFRSVAQAKSYLEAIARSHRLCRKLLGLEQSREHCFGYHLRRCHGACGGEEVPGEYNARMDRAFAGREACTWPFAGGLVVEESGLHDERETFLIDRWCVLGSVRNGEKHMVSSDYRFDFDSYKILHRYLRGGEADNFKVIDRSEFEKMVGHLTGSGQKGVAV